MNDAQAFMDRFGLRIPLVQAPMAGVSTPELAAAVSNAGALGSVALGALSAEAAEQTLQRTRSLTEGPFVANVFVHDTPVRDQRVESAFLAALAPRFRAAGVEPPEILSEIYRSFNDDDDMLNLLLAVRPAAVSLHFGPGTEERVSALKDAGISLFATATSVAEARLLEKRGIDFVVLQHSDAGGHSGRFLEEELGDEGQDLESLVQAVVASLEIPVVAAGGMMDGRDVRRVLGAGAAGAQLGTAFAVCPETLTGKAYRARLLEGGVTRVTSRISGRPARGLDNSLMRALTDLEAAIPDYPLTYDAVKQLIAATNEADFSVMWAGTGAGRTRFIGAADLVRRLSDELGAY
jgi:nitronate monooxygenase